MPKPELRDYHNDGDLFREALVFTQTQTGFSARLIEKDYYATILLEDLSSVESPVLVFKGGTCLGKVHQAFYRLSEDLDFGISAPVDLSRSDRSRHVAAVKVRLGRISRRLPCFRVAEALRGHNSSTQYVGRVVYRSQITGDEDSIKVEISVREPVLEPVVSLPAHTLLADAFRGTQVIEPISIPSLSCRETYAEKLRAALTRREPAIRDFYDIDQGIRSGKIAPGDAALRSLVQRKLAIPGNEPIDVSERKLQALRKQVGTQLKPVLRQRDLAVFELDRAFAIVKRIAAPWLPPTRH